MRRSPNTITRLAFSVLVVTVAGCGAMPVSTGPSATVPANATAAFRTLAPEEPFESRGPVPSGCYEVQAMPSMGPRTAEALAASSSTILLGTFDGHDEARWNTPDGQRPTPSEIIETSARLHRPIRMTVERPIRGPSTTPRTRSIRADASTVISSPSSAGASSSSASGPYSS